MSTADPPQPNMEHTGSGVPCAPGASRPWLALAVVYVAFFGLMQVRLVQTDRLFSGAANTQVTEAKCWWDGHLDLPRRVNDTALHDGKVYSHFPPMFTLVSAALVPLFGGVPHWFMVLFVALPMPLLAFLLFRRLVNNPWHATALAIALVCGTSVWPVLRIALRSGSPYFVNHAVATIGLLLMLVEYFGRRRIWVVGIGLLIAALSRQLTLAYAIPLLWLAWQRGEGSHRRRDMTVAVAFLTVIVALPMVLNTLKFGHPLTTGYTLIYEGRDDRFANDARTHGLFAAHFVPRNLYYANLGFPRLHRIEMAGETEYHLRPNTEATGIWWTTPLLIWIFFDRRRILGDPAARSLLVGAAGVFVALLFFHATGADQRGFNRFSLDYMPMLLVAIAPTCFSRRRRWVSGAMIVWSVVYFRFLI